MSLASKILVGLVMVGILALAATSLMTVKMYQAWGTKVNQRNATVTQLKNDIQNIRFGTNDEPGLFDLRNDLSRTLVRRGQVWYPVDRQGNPGPDGRVRVAPPPANALPQLAAAAAGPPQGRPPFPLVANINADIGRVRPPFPTGASVNQPVFAFGEIRSQQGPFEIVFLGQFQIEEFNQQANLPVATLAPNRSLTASELARLQQSQRWILYEVLPADDHHTFADVPEERLRRLLPESVVPLYLRDGQELQPNENIPPELVHVTVNLPTPVEADMPGGDGEKMQVDSVVLNESTAISLDMRDRAAGARTFSRPLHNYETVLPSLAHQRAAAMAYRDQLDRDKLSIETALTDARVEGEYRNQQIQQLQADVESLQNEIELLKNYADSLAAELEELRAKKDRVRAENLQLASAIISRQLERAEEIDRRTSASSPLLRPSTVASSR